MSRWGADDDALDAHIATFDIDSALIKAKQHQPPVVPSVPSYSSYHAASHPQNNWRSTASARPAPSSAPQVAGGAPLSSYISSPSLAPLSSADFAAPSRPSPFPFAPRFPPPAAPTAAAPSSYRPLAANQPTAPNVTPQYRAAAAPTVPPAPRHVPLPFPHLTTTSTSRPSAASLSTAAHQPPAPSASSSSSFPTSVPPYPPAFAPPPAPPPRSVGHSGPSAALPGFGRPSKPAWLDGSRRSPSPPAIDGRDGSPLAQRTFGPPPGELAGPWWKQFHADKAERLEQQKQKRREDSRARRQQNASTRVGRQQQQESAFLDPQFTRYVNQSMEPTEEERRRLREEGGGWKQRAVDSYAHMQCMADSVAAVEHSSQCERLVAWMARLGELKHSKQTYGNERSGTKRKTTQKLDKAGSAKKVRKAQQQEGDVALAEPVDSAKERRSSKGNDSEEDDIPLRPLPTVALGARELVKATADSAERSRAALVEEKEALLATEQGEGDTAVMLVDGSGEEDQPLLLLNTQSPLSSPSPPPSSHPSPAAASIRPFNPFFAFVTDVSSSAPCELVDFPALLPYEADDAEPSALISAQLQHLVIESDAADDVYLFAIEPTASPLPSPPPPPIPPQSTQTARAMTAQPMPAAAPPVSKPHSLQVSSRSAPPAAPLPSQPPPPSHDHHRMTPPSHPNPAASTPPTPPSSTPAAAFAPPRPLPPTFRPLPDPRSFMTATSPVASASLQPRTSPPRPRPEPVSNALTSVSVSHSGSTAAPRPPSVATVHTNRINPPFNMLPVHTSSPSRTSVTSLPNVPLPRPTLVSSPSISSSFSSSASSSPLSLPPPPSALAPPAPSSPAGDLSAAERELRREIAAAKREQWRRQHSGHLPTAMPNPTICTPSPGGGSSDSQPHATPQNPRTAAAAAAVQAPSNRTIPAAAMDVIDLADSSSSDDDVPPPQPRTRHAPAAPANLAPVPPSAPSVAHPAPTPAPAPSAAAAPSVPRMPYTGASDLPHVAAPSKVAQPFAAFRAPSVARLRGSSNSSSSGSGLGSTAGRADGAGKENVHANLCQQPSSNGIYSQLSQS